MKNWRTCVLLLGLLLAAQLSHAQEDEPLVAEPLDEGESSDDSIVSLDAIVDVEVPASPVPSPPFGNRSYHRCDVPGRYSPTKSFNVYSIIKCRAPSLETYRYQRRHCYAIAQ